MAKEKYYDRYKFYRNDGEVSTLSRIEISKRPTDIKIVYKQNSTRYDILSLRYYGTSKYGWIIQMANAQYGPFEFDVPDRATVRIPYPLEEVLEEYEEKAQIITGSDL